MLKVAEISQNITLTENCFITKMSPGQITQRFEQCTFRSNKIF